MKSIFGKSKDEEEKDSRQVNCSYSVETPREKWLIFGCKDCKAGSDLTETSCRKGVLKGLGDESNVGGVRLSGYLEKAYDRESLEVLMEMRRLMDEIDELSMRSTPSQEDLSCEKCKHNPKNIFSHLEKSFLRGIEDFYQELYSISNDVKEVNKKKKQCKNCIDNTRDDLVYLFNESEDLREKIFRYGYRILI